MRSKIKYYVRFQDQTLAESIQSHWDGYKSIQELMDDMGPEERERSFTVYKIEEMDFVGNES